MVIKQAQLAACDSGDPIAVSVTGVQSYPMVSSYYRTTRPAVVAVSKGDLKICN